MHKTTKPINLVCYCTIIAMSLLITGCGGGGGSVSQTVVPPETKGGDTSGPVFTQSSAVYNAQSKSTSLKATVSDSGSGIKTVQARIIPPGATAVIVNMVLNATTNEYTASYSVPDNLTTDVKTYQVEIIATDKSNNTTTQRSSFQVPGVTEPPADTTAPSITQVAAVFNAQTKAATLSATVTDAGSGVESVQAKVTLPGGGTVDIDLVYDATSSKYAAVYSNIPDNLTVDAKTYVVDISAIDKSGNTSTQQTSFEVAGTAPPPADTTAPSISQASAVYNAQAKAATLSATVTDAGSGVESVQATITLPGGGSTVLDLVYDATATKYTVVYSNVLDNSSPDAVTYTVSLTASDVSGNTSSQQTSFQVPGTTPPADTTAPSFGDLVAQYNAQTKAATLSAEVTDAGTGVESVRATVTLPAGGTTDFDLVYDSINNVFTTVYSGVPDNLTFDPVTYTVNFVASDKSGNTSSQQTSFEVEGATPPPGDTTPPTFAEFAAEYNAQTKAATLTASVADAESGIESVQATVTLPAGGTTVFDLVYDSLTGSFSAVYNNVPRNWDFEPKVYVVDFLALDRSGNSSTRQSSFQVDALDIPPPPGQ